PLPRGACGAGAHPRAAQHPAPARRDPLQRIQLRGRLRSRLAPHPARGPDARDQDGDRAHGLPAAAMTAMRSLPAMRASLARLRGTLWPDPASTSLGWWLVAIHLLLVLVVAGGISWYARGMLRDLADEQAKARVQLAATTAREDLRRMGEDALAAARALVERPTLLRLTAEGLCAAHP